MYPFERFMFKLKKYVHNKSRREGSIAKGFIAEKYMIFYSWYLHDVDSSLTRPTRKDDDSSSTEITLFGQTGHDLGTSEMIPLNVVDRERAHVYILMNCNAVKPYVD